MAKIDERVAALEAKLAQAKAEKQKRDARLKAAEGAVKRRADTTAKILMGAAALAAVKKMPNGAEWLNYLNAQLNEKDKKRLREAFEVLGIPIPTPAPQNAP